MQVVSPMEDSVQIRCPHCKGSLREKARKLISGFSRQCPRCEVVLFFEESSSKSEIKSALSAAKLLRRALLEQDVERPPRAPYVFAR